jgi:GNAT superfamily N-acetyltransferase
MVIVRPSHWRRGLASRLLALAEAEMRARGYGREQLWTPEGAPAEKLYRALGWERDGRREWHPWAALWMVGYAKAL